MNLFKIYSALAIVLVMCTYNAEGGIILLLLLKIIALKGALFFGMPLAIGSFMMGQGMGFFGGSLFGGYSMLNAAHKYHSGKGLGHKHKGLFKHHHKGVHHVHTTYPVHVVPSHGWGWGSRLATERPGWKAPAPTVHYHSYGYNEHKAQPSLLSKITSFPARLVNRFKPKPAIVSEYGDLGWSSNTPVVKETVGGGYGDGNGWSSVQPAASVPSHASSYGKNPAGQAGLHTYYDDANAGNEYGGTSGKGPSTSNMDDVDWSQGLANLLKAAEAQAEAEAANAPASAYKDTYEQSKSPQQSYGSPSSHYDGTSASGSSGYQNSPAQPEAGGYASGSDTGAGADTGSKTLIAGYTDNAQQGGYYDPSLVNSYYDRDGLASEEAPSVTSAPNSVIERFLESKLRAEMEKQKNVAEKKETAQLISMLRQVYIQELVDSLDGDTTGKRGVRMAVTTTELPEFIPFPGVPNSTTAKPKTIEVTSLKSEAPASATEGTENSNSRSTSVEAPPTSESTSGSVAKSPFVRAHQNGYLVGGDTDDVQESIASSSSKSADDDDEPEESPTRFVPMKTTWTLTRRQLLQARVRRRRQELLNQRLRSNAAAASNYNILADTVRTRRQTGAGAGAGTMDAAALSTFTDDVKKFFLLVSILDQDKCLQKLVCDVHTRGPGAQLTTYESNILVTFKVMNVLLPGNSEDATTNYRKAAKIGELSKAAAVCAKAYPTCVYSVSQIISMGNQVAETGNVDSASKITSKVDDATQTDTETDMETGASGVQIKTVSATDDQATAMPRV